MPSSSLLHCLASLPYSMSVHDLWMGRLDANSHSLYSAFLSTPRTEWNHSSPTRSSVSLSLACSALRSVIDLRGLRIEVHRHPKWTLTFVLKIKCTIRWRSFFLKPPYRKVVLLKLSIRSLGLKVEHKKGLWGHIFQTFLHVLFYRIDIYQYVLPQKEWGM